MIWYLVIAVVGAVICMFLLKIRNEVEKELILRAYRRKRAARLAKQQQQGPKEILQRGKDGPVRR